MSTFNRGLNDPFVAVFNEEYDKGGWLRELVDDKEIFLAIREQSVNFYYRGCSLLKMELDCLSGTMVGQIHYKYLLRPDADNRYITVKNGRPDYRGDAKNLFLDGFDEIGALKRAAKPYADAEKVGVHDILRANPNILDVEIAFGTGGNKESGASAPRADFAAIRDATVVLYEGKHFDNHKDLRAKGNRDPDVVRQIETYRGLLEANRDAVIKSYRCVCRNLVSLRGVAERHPERHTMLKDIVSGSRTLELDPHPRLVIFGYDADQLSGEKWKPHREKLQELLGERLLQKGSSKKFVRGISQ